MALIPPDIVRAAYAELVVTDLEKATVMPVSQGTCRRPRTAGWTAAW